MYIAPLRCYLNPAYQTLRGFQSGCYTTEADFRDCTSDSMGGAETKERLLVTGLSASFSLDIGLREGAMVLLDLTST